MHKRYSLNTINTALHIKERNSLFLLSAKTDHGDFIEEKNNNVVKTAVLFIDENFPGQKLLGKSHYFDDSWLHSWLCFFEEIFIAEEVCAACGFLIRWFVLFYVEWKFLEAFSSRSPMDKSLLSWISCKSLGNDSDRSDSILDDFLSRLFRRG